ncbi:MAG TPA: SMP-30/gluconolactonase/LRE family protein [Bacteriovoracaceae bacterium]|nr:SMP-30/gluconolactonase/LRE family protein [Bacteriovoracaceae bacterium]
MGQGLKAPKGLAIRGNDLFVTDINRVVKVDIAKGSISRIFEVEGSKFLNDIVIDEEGTVFTSDMFSNVIYQIRGNSVSRFVEDDRISGANGLYLKGEQLVVSRWDSEIDLNTFVSKQLGDVVSISLKNPKEMSTSNAVTGHLDGLTYDNEGNQLLSDWMNGDVFRVDRAGRSEKLYNFGQGTADISFAKELNTLLVPQMNQSKLILIKF